jgi:hypothetical protein
MLFFIRFYTHFYEILPTPQMYPNFAEISFNVLLF